MVSRARKEHMKRIRQGQDTNRHVRTQTTTSESSPPRLLDPESSIISSTREDSGGETLGEENNGVWFWDSDAEECNTDTEVEDLGGDSDMDHEDDVEIETETNTQGKRTLSWAADADKHLRGSYGNGSRSAGKRARKHAKELQSEAAKSFNIKALFNRQRDLNLSSPTMHDDVPVESHPLSSLPSGDAVPQSAQAIKEERTRVALADLKVLLAKKIDQEKDKVVSRRD